MLLRGLLPYLATVLRMMRRRAVIFVVAIGASVAAFGTPHVAWDYVCRHAKMYNPRCQAYEYCAYYGVYGRRVVYPEPGERCLVVKFLPR